MSSRTGAVGLGRAQMLRRLADFLSLTKPRLVPMVLIATAAGFYLASPRGLDLLLLLHLLVGTALSTGGSLALNQAAEEDLDARMDRTRERPLPGGRLMRLEATAFGMSLTAGGVLYLAALVNPMSAALTALTAVVYLFLYTPLKRLTSLNSVVGAVPGALPPAIGWAAASNSFTTEAFVLFSIVFIWQIPHALAIGVMYREEFARAGVRLLPVEEPGGQSTRRQVVSYGLALLPVAMMPTFIGIAGGPYFLISLVLGLVYLAFGVRLAREYTVAAARRLFYVSLVYLPLVLLAMALNRTGA